MKRKINPEANPYAPIFIRQIADSMIVMAAALLIVGVDLKDYFKPESKEYNVIIEKQQKLIQSLELRLRKVEELAHKRK